MGIVLGRANGWGRLEAFDRFVLRHQGMVYNVAYRILGEEVLAVEATRDVFAWSFPVFVDLDGSARLWLLRTVANLCQDRLRHGHLPSRAPSIPTDPTQDCLGLLPPEQRIALVLADVQGLTYREVADATGVPVGVACSRLRQGRAALRNVLLARGELDPEYPDRVREGQVL